MVAAAARVPGYERSRAYTACTVLGYSHERAVFVLTAGDDSALYPFTVKALWSAITNQAHLKLVVAPALAPTISSRKRTRART